MFIHVIRKEVKYGMKRLNCLLNIAYKPELEDMSISVSVLEGTWRAHNFQINIFIWCDWYILCHHIQVLCKIATHLEPYMY